MSQIVYHKLSPLAIHLGRYSDKYMNNAMIGALYWRIRCYNCGKPIYAYDPEDDNYLLCSCGERKRTPIFSKDFILDWSNDQRRRDGFKFLFPSVK